MRSSFLRLACLFFPLLAAIGCTEEFVASGGSGGGGTTTTTGGGGAAQTTTTSTSSSVCAPVHDTECDACLVQSCATPYCACADIPACDAYFTCLGDAQSQSDFEKCGYDHPNAIAQAGRVWSCASKHCAVCNLPTLGDCINCEFDKCPSEVNACLGNEACVGYATCLQKCAVGDQSCAMGCYNDHQAGANALNDLGTCGHNKCPMVCP